MIIIKRRAPLTQEDFGQLPIEGRRVSSGDSRPFRAIRSVALEHNVLTAGPRANPIDLTTPTVETTTIKNVNVEAQEPGSLTPAGPLLTLVETSHTGPPIYNPLNLSREKHA